MKSTPFLPRFGWFIFILIGIMSLVSCGETFLPTPTAAVLPTPVTSTPAPTPTAETMVAIEIAAADLVLSLPDTWIIGEGLVTPLGLVFYLGPEPLGPGPSSSTLIVADGTQYDVASLAAAILCGNNCALALEPTELAGQSGQKIIFTAPNTPTLEWFFLEHDDQILAFTLHDPITLITQPQIIASLEMVERVVIVPTTTPTETPLPPTPTFTPAPPTPTPGPPTDDPLDVMIAFLRAAANDPNTLGITYLSNELRVRVGTGETLLSLMNLENDFSNFTVEFISNLNGVRTYQASLIFTEHPTVWRNIFMIAEDGQWVISGFEIIAPPAITPTPGITPTLTITPAE